jgi:hypothetical protein
MVLYRLAIIPMIIAIITVARVEVGQCQSYRDCRECHSDIFELWKNSLHAQSYENPTFRATFMTIKFGCGEVIAKECLSCHAPMAYLANDLDTGSPAMAEGVSCTFCHSISSVNHGNFDTYYNLDTSGVMYGPYEAAGEAGHGTQYLPLYLESELCAGCHEYVNDYGVGVLETYREWKASPYPDNGVHCQNCHMPIMPDLSVADNCDVTSYYVTAHEFRGGHSDINLAYAVTLETEATKRGRKLDVKVKITNAESGHKLPTGIPIRRLVLNVTLRSAYDSAEVAAVRKVYRKVLTDKYGTIIENVPDMFLNATSIYSDNRIAPKETRVEDITFDIPRWVSNYYVETTLNYEYSRPILTEESISIPMARNVISSGAIR